MLLSRSTRPAAAAVPSPLAGEGGAKAPDEGVSLRYIAEETAAFSGFALFSASVIVLCTLFDPDFSASRSGVRQPLAESAQFPTHPPVRPLAHAAGATQRPGMGLFSSRRADPLENLIVRLERERAP